MKHAQRIRRVGIISAAAVATLSLALAGCSSSGGGTAPSSNPKGATIGALYLDAQGFYGGIKKGIEDGAKADNIKLIGQNSAGDATKEAQFMSTLTSGGVKAIIMSPVSDTASVPVVRQAHDAGIPVICYNTCITDSAAKGLVYALVTTDQKKLGHDVGIEAGNYFKAKGNMSPRIAILNCDVYQACVERKAGFKTAVESVLPDVQWAADQAGFEPDKATSTATTILTGDPKVDAFFATTDNGTIGAVQGVLATSRTGKTVVFGNDISLQLAKYFVSNPNILIATTGQNAQAMGRGAVKQALNAIKGEKVENYLTTIPTTLFKASDKAQITQWITTHADGIP
ncbi:MAG: sugar transport system substrate-binding protein [Mycobacterium sp.]|nr:sugar transport system substrate-binding protein [Mycobacterium sp.]